MAYSRDQQERLYDLAEQIVGGQRTLSECEAELKNDPDLATKSTSMTIGFFRCCIEGTPFKRGVSIPDAKFALNHAQTIPNRLVATVECLRLFLEYSEGQRGNRRPGIAKVLDTFVSNSELMNFGCVDRLTVRTKETSDFARTLDLSDEELMHLAQQADDKAVPPISTRSTYRPRNQHVKAHTLRQANGNCGYCGKKAPFQNDKGDWFLEVHHKQHLADGGPDTIENTVALCPDCHRMAHYGKDRGEMF